MPLALLFLFLAKLHW
jgi:hypothetical protein